MVSRSCHGRLGPSDELEIGSMSFVLYLVIFLNLLSSCVAIPIHPFDYGILYIPVLVGATRMTPDIAHKVIQVGRGPEDQRYT